MDFMTVGLEGVYCFFSDSVPRSNLSLIPDPDMSSCTLCCPGDFLSLFVLGLWGRAGLTLVVFCWGRSRVRSTSVRNSCSLPVYRRGPIWKDSWTIAVFRYFSPKSESMIIIIIRHFRSAATSGSYKLHSTGKIHQSVEESGKKTWNSDIVWPTQLNIE
jgi:hypothetical protein